MWKFTTNTGIEFISEFYDYGGACAEYIAYLIDLGYLEVEEK